MTQTPKDTTPTHRRHNPYHDYREACIYHITLVCSDRGQVLVLVPSELPHIANKRAITRTECTLLNARAAEIADEGMGT